MSVLRYPPVGLPRSGLVFLCRPFRANTDAGARKDLVNGNSGTLLATGSWSAAGLASADTTNGGASIVPGSSVWSIGTAYTVVVRATVDALVSSSKLLCIPLASGTWNTPFLSLSFGRNAANPRLALQHSSGSSVLTSTSVDGGIAAGETVTYGATRNGNTVLFYRDGSAIATNTNASGTTAPNFTNQQPVCLMQRSNTAPGEGTQGTLLFAAIWDRDLSAAEMQQVHTFAKAA